MGIALFPSDGETADQLMKNADTAMYAAKASGRNTFRFFDPLMTEHAEQRLQLIADLRDAIERDQFELYFQPQINLKTGLPCGAEALIRWHHPTRGMIQPSEFIPIAERANLIIPIGEWVIRETCRFLSTLRAQGINDLLVSINLSAPQLLDHSVTTLLKAQMEKYAIPGHQIEFELTESSVMHDPDHVADHFRALQKLGITIAIDDFGTGYSSLSYLRKLPLDTLKIDRAFVADIEDDADDVEIIRTIIALAKTLGLSIVAEGVENDQQAAFLFKEGGDMAQGYLYSKPLPAKEFVSWVLLHSDGAMNRRCAHA
jgi:EAL domain-containing protein (putative c-di-GMP-specific phosphodiesterase class I)